MTLSIDAVTQSYEILYSMLGDYDMQVNVTIQATTS
jgi:hypothetical protein